MSSAAAMVLIRHYFISRRYSVRCPTNTIALHIAQLLCYSEKDNLCSLLDSGRKIFYWSKLTMPSSRVQPWVRGRSAGSFPEQRLVIEPRYVTASEKLFCSCLYFFLYTRFNLLSDTSLCLAIYGVQSIIRTSNCNGSRFVGSERCATCLSLLGLIGCW